MRSKLLLFLNLRFYHERIWPNYHKVLQTSNQWFNGYLYFHFYFHKIDDENIDGPIYRWNICNLNIPKNHGFYIFQITATFLWLHFSKSFCEKHLQSLSLKMLYLLTFYGLASKVRMIPHQIVFWNQKYWEININFNSSPFSSININDSSLLTQAAVQLAHSQLHFRLHIAFISVR